MVVGGMGRCVGEGLIFEIFPDVLHAKILHTSVLGCAVSAYKINGS